ncbi:hypothetical protein PIB30_048404 [Stylosanthes scabra]|uniref:Uncharacterized protein n=1 Tax=Stylosanthes scabra TaxID=79078 RepID=A0ABU6QHP9_9FABA|nr:hypothetical protein [Stylosanthes scabra]
MVGLYERYIRMSSLLPLSSSPICSLLVFCASLHRCFCSLSPPISSLVLCFRCKSSLAAAAGLCACAISVAATALSSRQSVQATSPLHHPFILSQLLSASRSDSVIHRLVQQNTGIVRPRISDGLTRRLFYRPQPRHVPSLHTGPTFVSCFAVAAPPCSCSSPLTPISFLLHQPLPLPFTEREIRSRQPPRGFSCFWSCDFPIWSIAVVSLSTP